MAITVLGPWKLIMVFFCPVIERQGCLLSVNVKTVKPVLCISVRHYFFLGQLSTDIFQIHLFQLGGFSTLNSF